MPVIMEGRGDGPTIRYQPVSLTAMYLGAARKSAGGALAILGPPQERLQERLELAILTVIWSALALEAGANEFAEDVFRSDVIGDFDRCRRSFHKPKEVSRTVWKWHKLFGAKSESSRPVSDPIFVAAEHLVQTRHLLSHYRPQHTSRKLHYEPSPPVRTADGMYSRIMWSFDMEPVNVEPSLVELELLDDKPREHFSAAWNVFHEWEIECGGDGSQLESIVARL